MEMSKTKSEALGFADWIAVAVGYRESHASIASGYTPQFEDVERFVFLEVFVRYY